MTSEEYAFRIPSEGPRTQRHSSVLKKAGEHHWEHRETLRRVQLKIWWGVAHWYLSLIFQKIMNKSFVLCVSVGVHCVYGACWFSRCGRIILHESRLSLLWQPCEVWHTHGHGKQKLGKNTRHTVVVCKNKNFQMCIRTGNFAKIVIIGRLHMNSMMWKMGMFDSFGEIGVYLFHYVMYTEILRNQNFFKVHIPSFWCN